MWNNKDYVYLNIYLMFTPLDYMLLTIFLPGSYNMRKGKDPGALLQDENLRKQLYQDKSYKQELEYLLPRMMHLGYFELPEQK